MRPDACSDSQYNTWKKHRSYFLSLEVIRLLFQSYKSASAACMSGCCCGAVKYFLMPSAGPGWADATQRLIASPMSCTASLLYRRGARDPGTSASGKEL